MLDERGNRNPKDWPEPLQTRGGMPYHPPTHNWVGYGLKVWGQYDNGNNDWIAMDGNANEWAIAYHGTETKAVKPICEVNGKFLVLLKRVQLAKSVKNSLMLIKNLKIYIKNVVKGHIVLL